MRACFQSEVAKQNLRHFLDPWEARVRHKLRRWKLEGLPRRYAELFIHNLASLKHMVAPRVAAAVWGLAWNRWCTSRRFQRRSPCLLGCDAGEDSIEHYIGCNIGREAGRRLLRIEGEYEHRKSSMLSAKSFTSAKDQTCWAILVYGLYMTTNYRRAHAIKGGSVETAVQEVMQFCRRAVEGHLKSSSTLNRLWTSS